jgi:hypothetical protein
MLSFWANPRKVQASEWASRWKALQLRTRSREASSLLPLKASLGEVESLVQISEALCSRARRWPAMCLPPPPPRTSNVCPVDSSAHEMKALNACPICDLSCGPWMDSL